MARGFLLAMQIDGESHGMEVPVTDWGRMHTKWCLQNIRAATEGSPIMDTREMECMIKVKIYTDAAGGSCY